MNHGTGDSSNLNEKRQYPDRLLGPAFPAGQGSHGPAQQVRRRRGGVRRVAPGCGALVEGWTVERLETVLRAILRAGAYEILARPDIPPRVSISEYVEIAHAFFGGREPGLVNGVLDRLAQERRAGDLEPG